MTGWSDMVMVVMSVDDGDEDPKTMPMRISLNAVQLTASSVKTGVFAFPGNGEANAHATQSTRRCSRQLSNDYRELDLHSTYLNRLSGTTTQHRPSFPSRGTLLPLSLFHWIDILTILSSPPLHRSRPRLPLSFRFCMTQ